MTLSTSLAKFSITTAHSSLAFGGSAQQPPAAFISAAALDGVAYRLEVLVARVQSKCKAHRVRAAVLQALDLEALPAALQRATQEVGVGGGQRGHAPERVLGLVQQAIPAAPL